MSRSQISNRLNQGVKIYTVYRAGRDDPLELRPRPINQFVIAETAAYNLGGELCKVHLLERGYKAYDFERGLSD